MNKLWHRLLKEDKNVELNWRVWILLKPSKIDSCEEGWVKRNVLLLFFFLSHGLIKLSGEIRGFGNNTVNCYENYLFGYTFKHVWNTAYFFGDNLQGKELNNDLSFLSGDTTLKNLLESVAERR